MKKVFVPLLLVLLVCLVGVLPALAQEKTHTNSIGMEFVLIPAGSFPWSVPETANLAGKVVTVNISKPFYLGKYEVTQEQWRAVTGGNPSRFQNPQNPVEMVSWNDVQNFIALLNEKEGTQKYRLPTEAEWELAARGGTTGDYFFGNKESKLGKYAWFDRNSDDTTHPVGQKKPNPYGLYDIYGNVREWVQDWYEYRYSGTTDPTGPSSGDYRVLRGGSWSYFAKSCQSSSRSSGDPNGRCGSYGFRLAF